MHMQEYPKMLYLDPDSPAIVHDEGAEARARGQGYAMFHELGTATPSNPEPEPIPAEIAGMDKETLVAFAKDRFGLDLDKRFGLDKLLEQVAARMAGA